MPRRTWVDTEIVTAANVNAFLMDQSIMSCTSSTRPASPAEPWIVAETDTDSLSVYNGTAWRRLPGGGWGPEARALSLRKSGVVTNPTGASIAVPLAGWTVIRDSENMMDSTGTTLTVRTDGMFVAYIAWTSNYRERLQIDMPRFGGTEPALPYITQNTGSDIENLIGWGYLAANQVHTFEAEMSFYDVGYDVAYSATVDIVRLSW